MKGWWCSRPQRAYAMQRWRCFEVLASAQPCKCERWSTWQRSSRAWGAKRKGALLFVFCPLRWLMCEVRYTVIHHIPLTAWLNGMFDLFSLLAIRPHISCGVSGVAERFSHRRQRCRCLPLASRDVL